eukprot:TRINITY_DN8004_c0_g1_i1.p1 TRINITY_DN8004_c0_g1~~TRINITY_DN8004_c0_g1_i1.p1  ORF type:complete len:544 (-),score=84.96 TRINITY_DN8004_c0_g1_i1:31-1662(-)
MEDQEKPKQDPESIYYAAVVGDLEKVETLISSGNATVNSVDNDGNTSLHWAALNCQTHVIDYLLDQGASPKIKNYTDGQTPVHWAVISGNCTTVDNIIQENYDLLHLIDNSGYNALHTAVQYDHKNIAHYCLIMGGDPLANVDCTDNMGHTPLHWAAYKGYTEMSRILLSHGANINAQNSSGFTPLHWAVVKDFKDVVFLLVAKGADIWLVDNIHKTPENYASEYGRERLRRYLANKALTPVTGELRGPYYEKLWFLVSFSFLWIIFLSIEFLPYYTIPFIALGLLQIIRFTIMGKWPGMGVANTMWVGWFVTMYMVSTVWYFAEIIGRIMHLYPTETIAFIILNCILASTFLKLCFGDPGRIETHHEEENKFKFLDAVKNERKFRLCATCLIEKPPRSKHCRQTDICVRRFDHYCFWIFNSVGEKNHVLFIILLFMIVFLHFFFVRFCIAAISLVQVEGGGMWLIQGYKSLPAITVLFFIHFFHGLWEAWLIYTQMKNIVNNMTLNEYINHKKYPEFEDQFGNFRNPYDKGYSQNLSNFFFK